MTLAEIIIVALFLASSILNVWLFTRSEYHKRAAKTAEKISQFWHESAMMYQKEKNELLDLLDKWRERPN